MHPTGRIPLPKKKKKVDSHSSNFIEERGALFMEGNSWGARCWSFIHGWITFVFSACYSQYLHKKCSHL